MRISDWSSDVCSSDLCSNGATSVSGTFTNPVGAFGFFSEPDPFSVHSFTLSLSDGSSISGDFSGNAGAGFLGWVGDNITGFTISSDVSFAFGDFYRSEEHTSELQSLMRISYAVFCLKKKNQTQY